MILQKNLLICKLPCTLLENELDNASFPQSSDAILHVIYVAHWVVYFAATDLA